MKRYEITLLNVPGTPLPWTQRIFDGLSPQIQVAEHYRLAYAITHRGVTYEEAQQIYIDVELDEERYGEHLLDNIFQHKKWVMRYLIVRKEAENG